jgi:hypothetical protein
MVLDPVFHLRGGRSLPIPPPWGHLDGFLQKAGALQQLSWPVPSPRASQQLFLWFFLLLGVVAFSVVRGWQVSRTRPSSVRARTLLIVALFSAGILPQALQRVDSAHFAWVGCVPFGFLPVALFEFLRRHAGPRARVRTLALASAAGALALIVFVIPAFTVTRYADYVLQTFDAHRHCRDRARRPHLLLRQGGPAEAANLVLAEAAHLEARPEAVRRAGEPAQDAVQRCVPLLCCRS